jgi:hypothetical protein
MNNVQTTKTTKDVPGFDVRHLILAIPFRYPAPYSIDGSPDALLSSYCSGQPTEPRSILEPPLYETLKLPTLLDKV